MTNFNNKAKTKWILVVVVKCRHRENGLLSVNQMISPFLRLKSPVNHLRPAVVDQIWKIRAIYHWFDSILAWKRRWSIIYLHGKESELKTMRSMAICSLKSICKKKKSLHPETVPRRRPKFRQSLGEEGSSTLTT